MRGKTFLIDCPFELIHDKSIQMNDETTLICKQTIQTSHSSLLVLEQTIQMNNSFELIIDLLRFLLNQL